MFAIFDENTFTPTALRAAFYRPRRHSVPASIVIVLLLSLLFAGAISAALTPHPVPEAAQAAIEGGL